MSSINKVILLGRLGGNPAVHRTQDGKTLVNFALATNERWRDKATGERKEKVEWHRVVIFNERLAEIAEKFLKKGSTVLVEGQLQTRKWLDQSGQDRHTTEVVLAAYRGELIMLDARGVEGAALDSRPEGYDDQSDIPF